MKKLILSFALLMGAFFVSVATVRADVVPVGTTVKLQATADGTAPFNYVWSKAGVVIAGATADTLTLANFAAGDAAAYSVKISNAAGSANATVTLTGMFPPTNPKISVIQQVIAWIKHIFAKIFA